MSFPCSNFFRVQRCKQAANTRSQIEGRRLYVLSPHPSPHVLSSLPSCCLPESILFVSAVIDGVKMIYKHKILPLEKQFHFEDFLSPSLTDTDLEGARTCFPSLHDLLHAMQPSPWSCYWASIQRAKQLSLRFLCTPGCMQMNLPDWWLDSVFGRARFSRQ